MKNLLKKNIRIKLIKFIILNNKKIYINKNINNLIKIKILIKKKKNKINIIIYKLKNKNIPIYIIYIYKKKYISKKILNINLIIKSNNNINLIEEYYIYKNNNNNKYINCNYNIKLYNNTILNYIKIINLNKKTIFYSKNNIKIKKNSKFYENIFLIKSKKIIINNKINLYKNSFININNISIIKKKTNFYYKIHIIHNKPNSKSYQKHKNIIISSGIIKFIGIITILKKAYNSIAILENNNLCFDKPNFIYSKPQLNIKNKKTKCKHKVTINNINKKIYFYLSSRSLNKYKIRKIMFIIFINDIIKKIKNKIIKKNIYKIILNKYK